MNQKTKSAVLITGAGTGIGFATAQIFSEQGHPVVLTGRRKQVLETAAQKLKTQSLVIACDLTKPSDVTHLVTETLREMPNISILVNNAGIYERKPFTDTTDEFWQKTFEANFFSAVRLTRLMVPHFQTQKSGVIINVASTAGLRPVGGLSTYASSKAAMISLTQNLALELASQKIRVHCVCPGVVETPILHLERHSVSEQNKLRESLNQLHPLGRIGTAEEVGWAIYQLSTPQTQWMTGVVLPVDGGISLT